MSPSLLRIVRSKLQHHPPQTVPLCPCLRRCALAISPPQAAADVEGPGIFSDMEQFEGRKRLQTQVSPLPSSGCEFTYPWSTCRTRLPCGFDRQFDDLARRIM